ncbi:SRPBCC family protein [Demequina mangrovi]|uniref:Carbon monoxide dehydrogenase subunit G n=1 Tax=Demequina mangrovi TaxID=1043493 RepID=A0A1H7APY5_9MICO|nr:SRPBCC family protein [Demequina mangrovi]SEJ67629.1 Carbon monoxide dehydrogenase subunit G [Demequina mangrovi]
MVGHSVRAEREIAADVERVWEVITDLDYASEVIPAILHIERLEGEGYEVGVRWRETRKMWGREETEEMWVETVDAPRSTTVRAESRGTEYVTTYTLEPLADGTRIVCDFSAETPHPGPAQRVGWFLFGKAGMKATRKALADDLDHVAKAAEHVEDE